MGSSLCIRETYETSFITLIGASMEKRFKIATTINTEQASSNNNNKQAISYQTHETLYDGP